MIESKEIGNKFLLKLIEKKKSFQLNAHYIITCITHILNDSYNILEDSRHTGDVSINKLLLLHYIKQVDSMLPWVC